MTTYVITENDVVKFLTNVRTQYGDHVHDCLAQTVRRRFVDKKLIPGGLWVMMREYVSDHERGVDSYDTLADMPMVDRVGETITSETYSELWNHLPNDFRKEPTQNMDELNGKANCSMM